MSYKFTVFDEDRSYMVELHHLPSNWMNHVSDEFAEAKIKQIQEVALAAIRTLYEQNYFGTEGKSPVSVYLDPTKDDGILEIGPKKRKITNLRDIIVKEAYVPKVGTVPIFSVSEQLDRNDSSKGGYNLRDLLRILRVLTRSEVLEVQHKSSHS
ncbi:MAG: hypothetical protein AAGF04_05410 [Chlamydiota bacterium]